MRRYELGRLELIPVGEGREFAVGGVRVAVFRGRKGDVWATSPLCPHGRGRLVDGIVGQGRVVCPLHARAFDLFTGAAVAEGCPGLSTYPVSVDAGGTISVELVNEKTEAA